MPKNNSKARKESRRIVAEVNARAVQISCKACGSRHRDSRSCDGNVKAF